MHESVLLGIVVFFAGTFRETGAFRRDAVGVRGLLVSRPVTSALSGSSYAVGRRCHVVVKNKNPQKNAGVGRCLPRLVRRRRWQNP